MSKDQKSNVSKNVETVEILIPLLNREMEEVDNLSKPIVKVIIVSTVKAVLEQTGQDFNSIKTVIARILVRDNCE